MTKQKSTKRALLLSALSLLMCVSMLIGSTFAWFTDNVASGNNVITAGNLDLVVEYTLDGEKWNDLDGADDLFQKSLWEPGHTEVVVLKVENKGSLALKYTANMNILNETKGTTKDGKDIVLSDILTVNTLTFEDAGVDPVFGINIAAKTIEEAFKSETGIAYDAAVSFKKGNILEEENHLNSGDIHYVAVKVDMPETVGNEANAKDQNSVPSIEFGINVLATQYNYESDSFGSDYDKDADYIEYNFVVNTFNDLKDAIKNGGNILLSGDVTMDDLLYVENGANVYLNMNGKTMTAGANIDPEGGFLWVKDGSSLTIDGNGTFDLGKNPGLSFLVPQGEVVIENGTFIREVAAGTDPQKVGGMFVGTKTGKLVIKNGYFDGGYYDANAELAFNGGFTETANDIAKRGQSGDTNMVRVALKNNISKNLNLSAANVKVYGGTFVGMNPAWGDEGCALPTTPYYLRPWSYCQGTFLDGQQIYDNKVEIPEGYNITEGTHADGRPTYTVNYSK